MFEGEYSTIAGEAGSTVSRNCTSAMSSMRAPFNEMLPVMRGVSILTRGVAAIAVSRLTICAAAAGWLLAGALADGGVEPACGVVLPGVACAVG